MNKKKKYFSILGKINLILLVAGIIIMGFSLWLLNNSMYAVEADLVNDRLETDITCLRSVLDCDEHGENWELIDGMLYSDEVPLGDGTIENAREEELFTSEKLTGTFFYLFKRTYNDDELVYVDGAGYMQGHYQRVAGTTKGPNGERLEGTYIDKKIADELENSPNGICCQIANVNGRSIYCRYELLRNQKGEIVGIISDGRDTDELASVLRKQQRRGIMLTIFEMLILGVLIGTLVHYILRMIGVIRERVELIGTGEFPDEPLKIKAHDELGDVAEEINKMVDSLKEKERIGAELSLARDIQAHMLPSIFPPFPEHDEFDIFAGMEPAKEVAGDFYDLFMLDNKNIAVVIGDVSGKGVPSALFMVIAKTLIKNHAQLGNTPAEVFTTVNQMLAEGNESSLFVTAWMGVLNIETGLLTYVNAGHNPPLILQGDGEYTFLKSRPGFVLAGMEGIRYRQNELQMQPGDRLFLYTDGVTDAMNSRDEMYGEERMCNYLNAHKSENCTDLIRGLRKDVDIFDEEEDQFDDITMLALHYKKKQEENTMLLREFDADTELLPDVIEFLENELEKMDCPMKATMQLSVALEELFVNVASYAYHEEKGKVTIGIAPCEEGGAIVRIEDSGLPFDPLSQADPDITLAAEDREVGGLGILMVRKTMDDVVYKYENGKNVVTLTKHF